MVQAYLGTQMGRMVPSRIFWNMRVPLSQEDTNGDINHSSLSIFRRSSALCNIFWSAYEFLASQLSKQSTVSESVSLIVKSRWDQ